jgi:hypothetical protein
MMQAVGSGESRIVRALALLLVAGTGIRLLAALVAGFAEWHSASEPFIPPGRARAFDVLTTFGLGGDGTGVLLALAAAAAVWWLLRTGDEMAALLQSCVVALFALTAVLAIMEATGVGLLYSVQPGAQLGRLIDATGFALAYVVISAGAILILRRGGLLYDEQLASDDVDAFVFAVDRKSGDVRAFLSVAEARRRMHTYSIEDDEFAFYTDEGVVLDASLDGDRVVLRPTSEERPAELLDRLKEFASARGITVDEDDVDDPTAYAAPISRWHWLEMWPPWMRPIGMLFRRTG